MIIKKDTIERIKQLIGKHHKALSIALTKDQPTLEQAYMHNWLNEHDSIEAPISHADMKLQQVPKNLPSGEAHDTSVEHLNSSLEHLIENQKSKVLSNIEGVIRDENSKYKFNALQNLDR